MNQRLGRVVLGIAATVCALGLQATAANHREAPITALDHKADITDVYAFMGYGAGSAGKVTLIMGVDPLLDPGTARTGSRSTTRSCTSSKIDNNHDAREDITLQFRFETDQRLPVAVPGVRRRGQRLRRATQLAGAGPARHADRAAPHHELRLRRARPAPALLGDGVPRQQPRFDLHAGGRPAALRRARPTSVRARWTTRRSTTRASSPCPPASRSSPVRPTTRSGSTSARRSTRSTCAARCAPGVLSAAQDAAAQNFASDTVSGYAVNTIAIEIPVKLLTRTGRVEPATSAGRDARHLGHDLAPARVGAAQQQRRARSVGPVPPGAAHGQSAHQRADHRHRIEGSLQHGPAGERRAVRELLRRPVAAARAQRAHRRRARHSRRAALRPAAAGAVRRLRLPPRARRPGRSPTCCA